MQVFPMISVEISIFQLKHLCFRIKNFLFVKGRSELQIRSCACLHVVEQSALADITNRLRNGMKADVVTLLNSVFSLSLFFFFFKLLLEGTLRYLKCVCLVSVLPVI